MNFTCNLLITLIGRYFSAKLCVSITCIMLMFVSVDTDTIVNVEDINDNLGIAKWVFVLLGMYNGIGILLGLLGNEVVLYCSYRFNALDVDEITLIMLHHLAITNMLNTLLELVPALSTIWAGKWVLGTVMCFVNEMVGFIPFTVQTILITVISCHKLYTLI